MTMTAPFPALAYRGKPALVKISAVGTAVPSRRLTNFDLEKMVETSDQWITERTGIKNRYIVSEGETCSDLGAKAALEACKKAGVDPKDIELIVFATITPDMMLPATACLVQHKIGAPHAWGFDLSIACSGFLYALQVGAQFIMSGCHKNVLVIGMDVMSSIVDYTDRQTCIIFGDGGGAVLLQPSESEEDGCFIDYLHEVDGSGGDFLCVPGGGSKHPSSHKTVENHDHFVKQDGPVVFKFATKRMPDLCVRLLERNSLTGQDVDVFVPHQANLRIIKSAVERLGMPMEKVVINIEEYGNTTAGTIPLALATALDSGRLKKGDLVLFAAMGAGLSTGASLIRWAY
ncbi:MAG: ketoacyl-ACP synthase III [Candidatus Melainabacteria bacterium]|uniref:Beta-ketoacyl-[acyl-carrier-protein] synthase III n=1 Tax=Candidatus Obscuribacter phosphatis TaxID=1906157 RepID=A0A8J7P795_9BACT|nr:ketoacyl-ACP synthase III [Candidatus Obscuribacter phosphatis]MCA0313805.1 ketoacyl-ACP synthase III [Candidatus Melainabacteria bacterium]OPZ90705.1 MAG: 3-oxoacyl-(acyl-carrier-protein) synthase 3 [bacterium ADurb.Bin425]